MENSQKRGVFSPSIKLDSESMINCLQALRNEYPSIKFISVSSDEEMHGFRVCFTELEETTVLEKNLLAATNHPIWIYPLTAYLIIHDIDKNRSDVFEKDLYDAIRRRFGKILDVTKLDSSSKRKNWRFEIDIPEYKELEVFQRDSFSEITISLPYNGETVKVFFWCRHCKRGGHFQHECSERAEPVASTKSELNSSGKADEKNENGMHFKKDLQTQSDSRSPEGNSEGPSEGCANFPLEPTESYAEKIGREEIMKAGILSDENKKLKKTKKSDSVSDGEVTTTNNLLTDKEIKKEYEDHDTHTVAKEEKCTINKKHEISENDGELANSLVPKEEFRSMFSENEGSSNHFVGASSHDDDIEISFVGYSNKKSPVKSPSRDSNLAGKAEAANFEENSRSPTDSKNGSFSFASLFTATPGPSHESPSVTKPMRGAEVTSVLSERLQECINQACDTIKILDRKTLDAFLIHVKKKSNPIRVALNYTANAKGLKEQLQKILHIYYNTPQTGTKEDIAFIKWLNGLVERFDGSIPRKRKRAGQSTDEKPNKK